MMPDACRFFLLVIGGLPRTQGLVSCVRTGGNTEDRRGQQTMVSAGEILAEVTRSSSSCQPQTCWSAGEQEPCRKLNRTLRLRKVALTPSPLPSLPPFFPMCHNHPPCTVPSLGWCRCSLNLDAESPGSRPRTSLTSFNRGVIQRSLLSPE